MSKSNNRLRKVFQDRIQVISLIFLVLSLFLMDVNLNIITAYGLIKVTVIGSTQIDASSLFWLGFILSLVFYFITCTRSLYIRRTHLTKFDIIFGTIGTIGLMIILSGGLLAFWNDDLLIPIFKYSVERISYYHIGIGLSLISVVYFALTKK